jgi:hypothetical protein
MKSMTLSLPSLNAQERALIALVKDSNRLWLPQTGPQTEAWLTDADELYYGGQAGGGKSDLLLGLSLTAHKRSIVFRRNYTQFRGEEGLLTRCERIVGDHGRFVGRLNGWKTNDGRTIEFGAVETLQDLAKWRGRAHDLKSFDELPEFLEAQYLFLTGWLRTTDPNQRVRIVGAGNPPLSAEGEWVIRRWAAWLDSQHPYPAAPGELRWYARIDDVDTEVESGKPFDHKGEQITPKSRTFIPASLSQNKFLSRDYVATLQSMPEPIRSQLLYGDFSVGRKDDPWQVIPTSWVEQAMRRWHPEQKPEGPATASGLDVARGGSAKTVLAQRWSNWFAPLQRYPGKDTPDGQEGRRIVLEALRNGGYCNIDVLGPGASVVDLCREVDADVVPVDFGRGVKHRDRTNLLKFVNVRAFAYWSFREALDPEKGDGIMLPPDNELKADLCAAHYSLRVNGIQVEPKDDIIGRLGRSPDAGDAVVLAAMPPLYAGVAFH